MTTFAAEKRHIFAAGVITLKNTRGSKAWWGLAAKERAWPYPG
jgi:hypothetical protein